MDLLCRQGRKFVASDVKEGMITRRDLLLGDVMIDKLPKVGVAGGDGRRRQARLCVRHRCAQGAQRFNRHRADGQCLFWVRRQRREEIGKSAALGLGRWRLDQGNQVGMVGAVLRMISLGVGVRAGLGFVREEAAVTNGLFQHGSNLLW